MTLYTLLLLVLSPLLFVTNVDGYITPKPIATRFVTCFEILTPPVYASTHCQVGIIYIAFREPLTVPHALLHHMLNDYGLHPV